MQVPCLCLGGLKSERKNLFRLFHNAFYQAPDILVFWNVAETLDYLQEIPKIVSSVHSVCQDFLEAVSCRKEQVIWIVWVAIINNTNDSMHKKQMDTSFAIKGHSGT